jgi:hypothetical protein
VESEVGIQPTHNPRQSFTPDRLGLLKQQAITFHPTDEQLDRAQDRWKRLGYCYRVEHFVGRVRFDAFNSKGGGVTPVHADLQVRLHQAERGVGNSREQLPVGIGRANRVIDALGRATGCQRLLCKGLACEFRAAVLNMGGARMCPLGPAAECYDVRW